MADPTATAGSAGQDRVTDSAALPHRCRLCGATPPLGGSDPDYTPRPHDTASEPEMWSQCADEDACRARWVAWQKSWNEAIFNG